MTDAEARVIYESALAGPGKVCKDAIAAADARWREVQKQISAMSTTAWNAHSNEVSEANRVFKETTREAHDAYYAYHKAKKGTPCPSVTNT